MFEQCSYLCPNAVRIPAYTYFREKLETGLTMSVKDDINRSARAWEATLGWDEPEKADEPQIETDELGDGVREADDVDDLDWGTTQFNIMQAVQVIGGAVIAIAIVTIVVNAVLTTDAVANSSGPFSGVIDSLETTGVSAMVLLVIGLLVAAATRLMGMFQGGF